MPRIMYGYVCSLGFVFMGISVCIQIVKQNVAVSVEE